MRLTAAGTTNLCINSVGQVLVCSPRAVVVQPCQECWLICLEHQARPSVLYNSNNELNRYLAEMAGNQRRGPKNVDELVPRLHGCSGSKEIQLEFL